MEWTGEMHPVVAPDVENSRSKHGNIPKIELAVWIIIGLASSLVVLRLYYHLFRGRRRLWSDDYFLMAALLCLIGNAVTIWEWIPYKLEPNVTTKPSEAQVLIGSLMGLFNSLALAFSKTSLVITFIRLTTGWWKSSLGLSIFVIDILFVIQAWSYWVQDCDGPTEPFRVQTTRDGCISFESITSLRLTVQILSCGLDAYFTVLPWKIVRSLELKRFEKIGLGIAMSFGCASLSSGLVRMVVLLRLANQTYEYQPLYSVGGYLFNYCEPGFSIVAACMPVLRKVFMDTILWKKISSGLRWIPNRHKKRPVTVILPLCEYSASSACEGKSTSDQTDTTLVRPETPTTPEKVAIYATPKKRATLNTPSTGRTCCACNSPQYQWKTSKSEADLPRTT